MTTINRKWAMPSRWTFEIPPVAELLARTLKGISVVVDPFSGRSELGTHRNDLATGGVHAVEYLDGLIASGVKAGAVLIDPPYSPRQISECYKGIGLKASKTDTQNAALYKAVKDRADALLESGGTAVCCGWNSSGMGVTRGYELVEMLVVCHGGAHNDTIVTVERKNPICDICGVTPMREVSGGTGNVTHDGRRWCGCDLNKNGSDQADS